MENLETKPAVLGYYNGTITVSFPNNGTEENPNPLTGFGAVIDLISDAEAETSQIDISITSSGAPLATLSIAGGYGEGADVTDISSVGETLSVNSNEDMTAYIQGMDWSALLDNARAAGIPEELVTQIDSALQSAAADASSTDSDAAAETGEPAADSTVSGDETDAAA